MHKKDQGKLGEALVVAQSIENGCAAFIEYGDNSKIDVIIEDSKHQLHRVQVKMVGREKKSPGVSKLYTYKNGPNYSFKYEQGSIDWFAVVDTKTRKIAWVDADWILSESISQLSLRHDDSKNGQKNRCNWFDDYTVFPF